MSERVKKKSAIKKKILENSLNLFANKGFDGTSMRDIAKAVGVTLPTIYYHFTNKEGLYKAVFQEVMENFLKVTATAAIGIDEIKEQLISMSMAKYKFVANNQDMMLLYMRELYNPNGLNSLIEGVSKGVKRFEILIRKGIKKGEFREIDLNLASWFLMGVFNIFDIRIITSGKLPSEEEIRSIVELALNGINIK